MHRSAVPAADRQARCSGLLAIRRTSRSPAARATRKLQCDVAVVGAGHNALVAAALLAREGLKVHVVEQKDMVGGACKTERPFANAPDLQQSTGAYLLGLMPPELLCLLDIELPCIRRDPHNFLPTTGDAYLLFGTDVEATKAQFLRFFSQKDWEANCRLQAELAAIRDDVAPTWMMEPLSVEDTAERFVRPSLRQVFVDLCRKPLSEYLARFEFESELLQGMYAVTDGFSGLNGGWDTPGTGMNFLIHNMCRLPGADGTWMIVKGGMGTVTRSLEAKCRASGVKFTLGNRVEDVLEKNGRIFGVGLADGTELRTEMGVMFGCDPYTLRDLVGRSNVDEEVDRKLDGVWLRKGTTMKINLALSDYPRFTCLPERIGQHRTTIHLLPQENIIANLRSAYADATEGRLAGFPTMEWYCQTAVDPTLTDSQGRILSALFVQWVPHDIKGSSWEKEESRYVQHLLSICDRFAPGTSDLVVDTFTLTPPKIEEHFGIRHGHIHHIDNTFGWNQRFPYRPGATGLYSCSAGTHPAGSVIGCAGHNAAATMLRDFGLKPSWLQ